MLEKLLKLYPEGSDITVMNMHYRYPHRDEDGIKRPDTMNIIYKDNITGKKNHVLIKNPKYRFFVINNKELYTNKNNEEYPLLFTEASNVTPIEVPYKKISKAIAEVVGKEGIYNDALEAGDKRTLRAFHQEPSIMNSDQDIEDHYRVEFASLYKNDIKKLTKSYFDIEVDIKDITGDFVKPGEAPINAISFLDESSNRVYTFLLKQPENPLIEQMEKLYKTGVINQEYIHNFIEKAVGGYKKMHKLNLENLEYKLIWFDEEIQLIYSFFSVLHKCDPDFFIGWNSSGFDMPYIIARIEALGYKPEDIMCDESWEDDNKFVKHYVDEKNYNDFAERGDYTFISGNSVHLDQMIQYCSRRKAKMGSMGSTKLDTIAEIVAGIHKLDYSHITTDIGKLPYLDYITFVLYNIMDVICQKAIEFKCNDLEYIFSKCIMNNTSYRKGHRQTVYLINRFTREWEKIGYIIGNNTNKNNEKPDKFAGALVGKWFNTSSYSKIHINGRPIMVCDNLVDFDFKSLYPSILLEFNVAPNTQLGKIIIPNQVFSMENFYNNDKYERGGEYVENLTTDYTIEFAHRWLGLANLVEFLQDWNEYNQTYKNCYSNNGKYNRFYRNEQNKVIEIPIHEMKRPESPIRYLDKGETSIQPVIIMSSCVGKEVKYNGFNAGAH